MGATSPQYQHEPASEGLPVAPAATAPSPEPTRQAESDPFGLLDQLPGAVLLLDPVGRVVHLNGIAELRLDLERSEAVGRDLFREILPELETTGAGARYRSAMKAGRVALACEVSFERASGPRRVGLGIRSYAFAGQ